MRPSSTLHGPAAKSELGTSGSWPLGARDERLGTGSLLFKPRPAFNELDSRAGNHDPALQGVPGTIVLALIVVSEILIFIMVSGVLVIGLCLFLKGLQMR